MESEMTAVRAIELLRSRDGVNFTLEEYCEAIDMAVQALMRYGEDTVKTLTRQWEESIFQDAIEEFGEAAQVTMVFEEMAELQKELCKWTRNGESVAATHHIAEEIADVEIMLDQMKLLFDIDGSVQAHRLEKVVRLGNRIEALKKQR